MADDTIEIVLPPPIDGTRLKADPHGETVQLAGETMGTSWMVTAICPASQDLTSLRKRIEAGFEVIISQMSQWEPDSEISLFNRAQATSWTAISPQFRMVLKSACAIALASDGAFDPAIGGLSELWGFGASPVPLQKPKASAAIEKHPYSWTDIRFSETGSKIYQPGDLELDLSAIAKGFAVDYTIALLEQQGIAHALVEIGGELRAIGVQSNAEPWWVEIENAPDEKNAQVSRIALSGWAIATTGHYLRRRSVDGESWSHSLSPQTCRPVTEAISTVSVLHPSCMQADALATAIAVLGPQQGLAFAQRHRLAVKLVAKGHAYYSDMWRDYAAETEEGAGQ
ncbi:FAD:protein FMN transferase [Parasphingorhabdus sp.]|uniref:FAD:protein FMN transferase n=1 Tax=Parasphingorhabdus sp. TaxID=2709688 RepID=UPI003A9278A5